jgi:hypothetical protein
MAADPFSNRYSAISAHQNRAFDPDPSISLDGLSALWALSRIVPILARAIHREFISTHTEKVTREVG